MILLLIGARGVGKTSLLAKLEWDRPNAVYVDLDQHIEQCERLSVEDIFTQFGEAHFRGLEQKYLDHLIESNRSTGAVIAVGAGFEGDIPAGAKVVWLQRVTDEQGRIFLDRPRLDKHLDPLQEYLKRYVHRKNVYSQQMDFEFQMPEGEHEQLSACFRRVFTDDPVDRRYGDFDVTIFEHMGKQKDFLRRQLQLGARYFELRDDLISKGCAEQLIREIPEARFLVSCREPQGWGRDLESSAFLVDWPVEWGAYNGSKPHVLSFHGEASQMDQAFQWFDQRSIASTRFLKLAVQVNSWEELIRGHNWWLQDPEKRCFLPMSKQGRWQWYRIRFGPRMPLNFIRYGQVYGVMDQPTIFQHHCYCIQPVKKFAAVLGDPVDHSMTPSFHYSFFAQYGMLVVAMPLKESEFNECTMNQLVEMGLTCAAVTAPLKQKVYEWLEATSGNISEEALRLQSVNTLALSATESSGFNTDLMGLQGLLQAVDPQTSCALWGGEGTRKAVQEVLPDIVCYSARTGKPKQESAPQDQVEQLIWAVGPQYRDTIKWPPNPWRPKIIYDLNYLENSLAKEYAMNTGAKYVSGLKMFVDQAKAQQKIWQKVLGPSNTNSSVN